MRRNMVVERHIRGIDKVLSGSELLNSVLIFPKSIILPIVTKIGSEVHPCDKCDINIELPNPIDRQNMLNSRKFYTYPTSCEHTYGFVSCDSENDIIVMKDMTNYSLFLSSYVLKTRGIIYELEV